MTLIELLQSIINVKSQLQTILGTDSDAFDEYPTLMYNYLANRYNYAYKLAYKQYSGRDYTGADKMPLRAYIPTVPSWQGQDTTEYSTLVNIMSSIADIRNSMKPVLNTTSDAFQIYPNLLNTRYSEYYTNGYAAGTTDGQASAPVLGNPQISQDGNAITIIWANAAMVTTWISQNQSGEPRISSTLRSNNLQPVNITVEEQYNGYWLCMSARASNTSTDSATYPYQLHYVSTEPVVVVPDAPTLERIENSNVIRVTWNGAPNAIIEYTLNGGVDNFSNSIHGSGTGTIVITHFTAANQIGARVKDTTTGQVSNTVWYDKDFTMYVAPDSSDPTQPGTPQSTPFWIKGTNQTSTYKIYTPEGTGKINISTRKDFNTIVTPSTVTKTINGTSTSVEEWTLNPNTYYYFRTLNTTASVAPKIEFNPGYSGTYSGSLKFIMGGNLQYLSNKAGTAGTLPTRCFSAYFGQDISSSSPSSSTANYFWTQTITDISQLYFPDGGTYSYQRMFKCCNKLTTLPDTISCVIGDHTCYQMFMSCNSITKGPNITSSSIGSTGCREMFDSCTAMTSTGNISATSVSANGMQYMFYSCSGLVTGPAELNCVRFTSYCYDSMFAYCKKLVKSPVINTQIDSNYGTPSSPLRNMFQNCSALNYIEVNFNPSGYTFSNLASNWVKSVKSSGTFKVGPNGGDWSGIEVGTSGRPSGWTLS